MLLIPYVSEVDKLTFDILPTRENQSPTAPVFCLRVWGLSSVEYL